MALLSITGRRFALFFQEVHTEDEAAYTFENSSGMVSSQEKLSSAIKTSSILKPFTSYSKSASIEEESFGKTQGTASMQSDVMLQPTSGSSIATDPTTPIMGRRKGEVSRTSGSYLSASIVDATPSVKTPLSAVRASPAGT